MSSGPRHVWGEPDRSSVYRTERTCRRCGLFKITRHEPGALPWVEFERDGVTIAGKMPPCRDLSAEAKR